ncbi:MAG: glycosyltransferase family 2 protein [Nocardioidaceae bacterium]
MWGRQKQPRTTQPSTIVFTMVKDEATMLPRWLDYYGRAFDPDRLLVIDDDSTDGSTDNLPCPVIRLRGSDWKPGWMQGRRAMVNSLASAMLAYHDVVIFTDVDEFLVPDPDRYSGLADYLSRNKDPVIAPVGLNVLHDEAAEAALDGARPVMQQRRLVKHAPVMCKPGIKRVRADWTAGFHGIETTYRVHPDLLLLHLKYCDVGELTKTSAARHELHVTSKRGGRASAWSKEASELAEKMRAWTARARTETPPDFDPYSIKTAGMVKRNDEGYFHVPGAQLRAMAREPLRVLPERYRVV